MSESLNKTTWGEWLLNYSLYLILMVMIISVVVY
jgi:hypothetical protein